MVWRAILADPLLTALHPRLRPNTVENGRVCLTQADPPRCHPVVVSWLSVKPVKARDHVRLASPRRQL